MSLALLAGVTAPRVAVACGGGSAHAVLTFDRHPDFPLDAFAAGELGILRPEFARSYLLAAWRVAHVDGPESDATVDALLHMWERRLRGGGAAYDEAVEALAVWEEQRNRIAASPLEPRFRTFRATPATRSYFPNCRPDAFRTAARALDSRIETYGLDDPYVADWLAAQDVVFANCGDGTGVPEPAPVGSPGWLRNDRAYQLAAADFYAMRFDEAARPFEAIAADPESPWAPISTYLVARTRLRQARLTGELEQAVIDGLNESVESLLENADIPQLHGAAADLRVATSAVAGGASMDWAFDALVAPDPGIDLGRAIEAILVYGARLTTERRQIGPQRLPPPAAAWVAAVHVHDWPPDERDPHHHLAGAESWDRWRTTQDAAWLVPALMHAADDAAWLPEAVEAARQVDTGYPLHATIAYYAALHALAGSDDEAARTLLDSVRRDRLPTGSANLIATVEIRYAESWDEWFAAAARRPVSVGWDDDAAQTRGAPWDSDERLVTEAAARAWNRFASFDAARAALDDAPDDLVGTLATAAWTRAIALGHTEDAETFAPALRAAHPVLGDALDTWAQADGAEQEFLAALLILRTPGLSPYLRGTTIRSAPVDERESRHANWWCAPVAWDRTPDPAPPSFLSQDELADAEAQFQRFVELPDGVVVAGATVVEFAEANLDHPDVPEALHRTVRASRFGCHSASHGEVSQAAFALLHREFPDSEWAESTPYWYD